MFLFVGVIAITGGSGTRHGGANQRTLATVVMIDQGASRRTGQRAQTAVGSGAIGAWRTLLIRVARGAAGEQQRRGAQGDQGQAEHEGISMNSE